MNKPISPETHTRTAKTAPATWNAETRTVEVIAATESPVQRRDAAGAYLETLDMATLDLSRATDLPVYDSHKGGSARDVIGIVEAARVEDGQLIATLRLSGADDATPVVQRVAEGTVTGVSVGYAVQAWRETRDAGQRVKRPAAWSLREISLTPNPADPNSRVRTETAPTESARVGGIPEQARWKKGRPMKDDTTLDRAEIERRSGIRGLVRAAGLAPEDADKLIDSGADLTRAKAEVFDVIQTRADAQPIIRVHAGSGDDPTVIRERQSDALAYRMAGGIEEPGPEVRQYLGESMLDMARGALSRSGVSTRGLSADDVFTRAAHGTSDFPLVVSNAMHKVALDTYKAAGSPLMGLTRKRLLSDFKASTSIRLGNMGRLEEIAESGEITHTSRAESGESLSLKTYARGITVSRNLLVNDDLGLLGDMTAAFGEAAAQTEADLLIDLLTANPDLSDGTPVFDASRGNLAGAGVSIGSTGDMSALDTARLAMRQIKGLDGRTLLSVTPRFLVVGPASETAAEQLLTSIYATTTDAVNVWPGKLTLIVEPRIADGRWYLMADPARFPTLVIAHLASAPGVQIQRADSWDTLGMKYRAWLDFGAGFSDWRGAYLNQGDA